MKRLLYPFVILSILMFACSISSSPVQPTETLPPGADHHSWSNRYVGPHGTARTCRKCFMQ